VLAAATVLAVHAMAAREAVVRAGLLLLVADLACQGQGGGVPGACRDGLAAGPQDFA